MVSISAVITANTINIRTNRYAGKIADAIIHIGSCSPGIGSSIVDLQFIIIGTVELPADGIENISITSSSVLIVCKPEQDNVKQSARLHAITW